MKILLTIEPGDISEDKYLTFGRWAICNDNSTDYGPFPFRMAYTSALLEREIKDIQIFFLDPFLDRLNREQFINSVEAIAPDIIIMQVSPILWQRDKIILHHLKKNIKNIRIILCGNYPSAEPELCLNECPEIDMILTGEYMQSALDTVRNYITRSTDFSHIGGAVYKNSSGIIIRNTRAPLMPVDSLPLPDRIRINPSRYRNFTIHHPTYQMLMSFGCPYNCIYCVERHVMYGNNQYRFRNPVNILDEMVYLQEHFGARQIWFDDDTATADKHALLEFCSLKIKRKVMLPFGIMGDLISFDEEMIRDLSHAGCICYAFGVESADAAVLKSIAKPIDINKIRYGVKLLKKYRIISHATFSFGHPGETPESMQRTFQFARNLGSDNAQFSIATPYPGTPFFKLAQKKGWIVEQDLSKYFGNLNAVVSYPQLKKEQIEKTVLSFNERWSHIAARKRILVAFRYPLRALAKIRHEGIFQTLQLIRKAIVP